MNFYRYTYIVLALSTFITLQSCGNKPYKKTEKIYDQKLDKLVDQMSAKEAPVLPLEDVYTNQLNTLFQKIKNNEEGAMVKKEVCEWISTVNFGLRRPSFVILHHTAQDSIQQTIKTFTMEKTQVSAHYIVGRTGRVVQMVNDYLRSWHGGNSSWGRNTDINSSSIGIELDNNGREPFSEEQINSLLFLLQKLKKDYNIPTQNFIGHSDIAPTRKQDPSAFFPWRTLAANGFGIWPDAILDEAPADFNIEMGLRIIGYDTKNLSAAIKAFKLHFIQTDKTDVVDAITRNTIYNVYKKM